MISVANRLKTVEEYYFSRKLKEIAAMKASGKPVINLGVGSPDLNPPQKVINALVEGISHEKAHAYQSYLGLPELREAIADFYREHYEVFMSPVNEILPLMGSKEGIMHISMAFLNKGDQVLIPNPGYPTYTAVTKLMEAEPIFYDLNEQGNWFPNLNKLESQDLSKVKLMWINYPHMPTGSKASKIALSKLVDFVKRNNILLINDNPYGFILNKNPLSILNIQGAKEVCLELNSLSKTFNMAGWRVGMVGGSAQHIQAVLQVKSNMDSGMFYGIQKGAIAALNGSSAWFKSMNSIYEKRRSIARKIFDALHCEYANDSAGLFVWARIPERFRELGSMEFSKILLKEAKVAVSPGIGFGEYGDEYVRFGLIENEQRTRQAIRNIKSLLLHPERVKI